MSAEVSESTCREDSGLLPRSEISRGSLEGAHADGMTDEAAADSNGGDSASEDPSSKDSPSPPRAAGGERSVVCTQSGLAVYICGECGDCLSSQEHLETHTRRNHTERPEGRHVCSYCPYSSNHRPNVTTHELTHTGGRPFSCRVCQKRFTRRNTLDEHLTVHTKERPYGCPDCGRRYTHPRSLSRHRMLHAPNGKPLACRFCARGFRDRYHLAVHLVTHTGERPHACRVCGQAFSQLGNARDHERRRHPGWRPEDEKGTTATPPAEAHNGGGSTSEGCSPPLASDIP